MPQNLVAGEGGPPARNVKSVICLALIVVLALVFWAGVIWGAEVLFKMVFG